MELFAWLLSTFYLLVLVTTLVVVITDRSNYNPSKAIVWLGLILFIPVLGVLLYFVF